VGIDTGNKIRYTTLTRKRESMNPKTINDPRMIVWTVSVEVPNTYCLYIGGELVVNNCSLDTFYPLFRRAMDNARALGLVA
jgi:hypothetical protein